MTTVTDSFMPLTVEMREKFKKNVAPPVDTNPLSVVYSWFSEHDRSLDDAPREMLKTTQEHLASRRVVLSKKLVKGKACVQSRVRVQLRWLARWERMIDDELSR